MRRQQDSTAELIAHLRDEGFSVPLVRVVCPSCDGYGHYVNPAIDGNGLSPDDIDRLGGDDFLDDYFKGAYDIRCEQCHGQNVIDDLDRDRADADAIKAWDRWLQAAADHRAEVAAERRMGA
jgi:hypothetical protein